MREPYIHVYITISTPGCTDRTNRPIDRLHAQTRRFTARSAERGPGCPNKPSQDLHGRSNQSCVDGGRPSPLFVR